MYSPRVVIVALPGFSPKHWPTPRSSRWKSPLTRRRSTRVWSMRWPRLLGTVRRLTPITGWKLTTASKVAPTTDARSENGSCSQNHHCRARLYPEHPARPLRARRCGHGDLASNGCRRRAGPGNLISPRIKGLACLGLAMRNNAPVVPLIPRDRLCGHGRRGGFGVVFGSRRCSIPSGGYVFGRPGAGFPRRLGRCRGPACLLRRLGRFGLPG